MNKYVCLYIYLSDESRFLIFPKAKISNKSIIEYHKGESDSFYVECINDPSDENYEIYESFGKHLIWISPTEGETICSGIMSFWFNERNDSKAINIALNYEMGILQDTTKRYNHTMTMLINKINNLRRYYNK